jgi:hypothetical protein
MYLGAGKPRRLIRSRRPGRDVGRKDQRSLSWAHVSTSSISALSGRSFWISITGRGLPNKGRDGTPDTMSENHRSNCREWLPPSFWGPWRVFPGRPLFHLLGDWYNSRSSPNLRTAWLPPPVVRAWLGVIIRVVGVNCQDIVIDRPKITISSTQSVDKCPTLSSVPPNSSRSICAAHVSSALRFSSSYPNRL